MVLLVLKCHKNVDCPFTSQMRTFSDLEKNKAPYLSSSCNFYSTLAAQLEASGHAFDLFCAGFEECGAMEMQCMVDKTGGLLCVVEEYTLESFQTVGSLQVIGFHFKCLSLCVL